MAGLFTLPTFQGFRFAQPGLAANTNWRAVPMRPVDENGDEGGIGLTAMSYGYVTLGSAAINVFAAANVTADNSALVYHGAMTNSQTPVSGGATNTCFQGAQVGNAPGFAVGPLSGARLHGGKWEAPQGASPPGHITNQAHKVWQSEQNRFNVGSATVNPSGCPFSTDTGWIRVGGTNANPCGGLMEDVRFYARPVREREFRTIQACKGHDGIHWMLEFRALLNEGTAGTPITGTTLRDISRFKRVVDTPPGSLPSYAGGACSFRRRNRASC